MLGATISLGSVATGLVANEFGLATSTSLAGTSVSESSAGIQIAYVFASVSSTSGCSSYGRVTGGSVLSVTVFDYGSTGFRPTAIAVNGTAYFWGTFPKVAPGAMATYHLTLTPPGSCAHPWGQTVVMFDSMGDDFQFET